MYWIYMIRNSADKLYIGITEEPNSRIRYHNQKRGAKFTRYIPDFKILLLEKYPYLPAARKHEIQIKKWRREKKEYLIERYQKGLPTAL